nr:MAG TPA: hypothetical protein [Caudoviricetes sp.]
MNRCLQHKGTLRGAFLMQKISVQRAQLQWIYISSLLLSGRNRRSPMELAGLYLIYQERR